MQAYLQFAEDLARESGAMIMDYFRSGVAVESKADQSPVTIADRNAEALMRTRISKQYPQHRILGEEDGMSGPQDATFQWVLDPIDGTKSFIHGVPLFGTLIALLEAGEPVLGAIHLPAMGDLLLGARGVPTTLNGAPVQVSQTRELKDATVLYTSASELVRQGYGNLFTLLEKRAKLVRNWGDCFGHYLVATGQADIMFDPIMNLWDIAALKPCVQGAGGRLTDKQGDDSGLGESALSTNGHLHKEFLSLLEETRGSAGD